MTPGAFAQGAPPPVDAGDIPPVATVDPGGDRPPDDNGNGGNPGNGGKPGNADGGAHPRDDRGRLADGSDERPVVPVENGGTVGGNGAPLSDPSGDSLPFTGFELAWVILAALVLLALGTALRLATQTRAQGS